MPKSKTEFVGIGIHLITHHDYLTSNPNDFVGALTAADFRPTLWGKDPPKKTFDASALLKQIHEEEYPSAVFTRAREPEWSGQYGRFLTRCFFRPLPTEKWLPSLFAWADSIAEIVQPEFGVCHPVLPQQNAAVANTCLVIGPELGECGLPWLGGRTYLSNGIVKRIGRELLRSVVGFSREWEWGVATDLLPEPWATDPAKLFARQKEVMGQLNRCGMFADYSSFLSPKKAPKWVAFEI